MKMSVKQVISYLKETYTKWSDHQAPRLGASVAFYSILSFAPLLILITGVIALVFGHESAQGALVNEARQLIGDRGAETVQNLLKNAQKPASGVFASLVAFITLLFGASGVFTELRDALNLMWDVKNPSASGVMGMVKQRLFSFGMVLSVGFLLLVSLILSAALAYIGRSFGQLVPMPPMILEALNFIVSFAVISALFALLFKYVPAAKISWRNVFVGAVGTALLFTIGKLLLGLYLGKASVGSTYGAAGSLVAVVVWIYYSAQIFFFGAEFTHVYAEGHKANGASAQQIAQKAETPVRMAAAIGSLSPGPAPLPTPNPPISAKAAGPVPPAITGHHEAVPVLQRPTPRPARIPAEFAPQQTRPRLLMAVALGFLVAKMVEGAKKNAGNALRHPHLASELRRERDT